MIKTEVELAKKIIEHFEGFDIYPEVPVPYSGRICDIVLKMGKLIVAVEVKMTFNLAVIFQAYENIKFANFSYVAVPCPSKAAFYRNPQAETICKILGIGVLYYNNELLGTHHKFYVHTIGNWRSRYTENKTTVIEVVKPGYQRSIYSIVLKDWMKRSVSGSQSDRLTDFKITVEEITAEIKRQGGRVLAKDFFKQNQYHYSSSTAARSSIQNLCSRGIITAFRFEYGYIIISEQTIAHEALVGDYRKV